MSRNPGYPTDNTYFNALPNATNLKNITTVNPIASNKPLPSPADIAYFTVTLQPRAMTDRFGNNYTFPGYFSNLTNPDPWIYNKICIEMYLSQPSVSAGSGGMVSAGLNLYKRGVKITPSFAVTVAGHENSPGRISAYDPSYMWAPTTAQSLYETGFIIPAFRMFDITGVEWDQYELFVDYNNTYYPTGYATAQIRVQYKKDDVYEHRTWA